MIKIDKFNEIMTRIKEVEFITSAWDCYMDHSLWLNPFIDSTFSSLHQRRGGGGGKVKSMVMEHQYSIISHLLKSEGNGKQKQRSLKKRRKNFRKKIKENKKSFKKELSAENGENSREEK